MCLPQLTQLLGQGQPTQNQTPTTLQPAGAQPQASPIAGVVQQMLSQGAPQNV